jgi:predicted protein tyrosine phosphatase
MIIVTSLHAAPSEFAKHKAARAIGILSPDSTHPVFAGLPPKNHLRLSFHDIIDATEGFSAPTMKDAEQLVSFIEEWNPARPMLIHCWAGISRSTASAFTTLCMKRPDEDEMDLAKELRDASPSATPNRLIVSQVDHILGRKGRMIRAIESIGRGEDAFEGTPFVLNV